MSRFKEVKLGYYIGDTLLITLYIYTHYGLSCYFGETILRIINTHYANKDQVAILGTAH